MASYPQASIYTENGPELVDCAASFGLWAATKHADVIRIVWGRDGSEVSRTRRPVRGWTITHLPSGASIGVQCSKRVAIAVAKQLNERFPKLGAKWSAGQATVTRREQKQVLELRDFIADELKLIIQPRSTTRPVRA